MRSGPLVMMAVSMRAAMQRTMATSFTVSGFSVGTVAEPAQYLGFWSLIACAFLPMYIAASVYTVSGSSEDFLLSDLILACLVFVVCCMYVARKRSSGNPAIASVLLYLFESA